MVDTPEIRVLPDNLVNQIAAGEVVERPSSVVKELVENSIDAGATKIEVTLIDGGKSLISVLDNGHGMSRDNLSKCIERHATSKLKNNDLFNINFMGFRGEALPSISSIARVSITTRTKDDDNAWELVIEGGNKKDIKPAKLNYGTKIEVRDLFFATPARLKFLKASSTETAKCVDIINRIAMANPEIAFYLDDGIKKKIALNAEQGELFDAQKKRLSKIMGKEFAENSILVNQQRENVKIYGHISLPTLNKNNSLAQYFFVNGRPVRDKLLLGATKGAYNEFLAGGRYPYACLFIEVEPIDVDVNVHPAKAEVRFRNSQLVTGLLVSSIRNAINSAGHLASNTLSSNAIDYIATNNTPTPAQSNLYETRRVENFQYQAKPVNKSYGNNLELNDYMPEIKDNVSVKTEMVNDDMVQTDFEKPLGLAKAQYHKNYIIAQTQDGITIIDQHAAHERLVYEDMKHNFENGKIQRQMLLIPEVVELDVSGFDYMMGCIEDLEKLGLVIEEFGDNTIVVREVPSLIGETDIKGLIKSIADDLAEHGTQISLSDKIHNIIATIACHGSVRSGRVLNFEEMNKLLRDMEATPHSGQCNHGRPTYVELKLSDIEKLFNRK